ncbi:photosystem I assembly protein Ycf3 [compost metagenome]
MRNSEAMAYAKQALKKNPDNPQAWSVLGQVHQVWKEYPQAREAYTKGLATGPFGADAADLHYHLGTLLSLKPDTLGEAVQHFQQALELQPRQTFEKRRGQIHTALGEAYEKQGKHAEAVAQYQAALQVFPSARAPRDNMARLTARVAIADKPAPMEAAAIEAGALRARMWNLHAKQQRYQAAVELGLQGVTRFPDDFMLWNELGAAYEKNGQALEAAKAFTTAIQLGGNQRDAAYPHYNLGRLMANAGKHQEAADYYKQAANLWPGNKDYHLLAAKEYEALNRPQEAAAEFQAVLKLAPDHAAAREGLARTKAR